MKNLFSGFVFFYLFLMPIGCHEKDGFSDFVKYEISLRSSDIESLGDSFYDLWDWALSEYGLELICSCECEDIQMIPNIWDEGKLMLPNWIQDSEIYPVTCSELMPIYKPICIFSDVEDAAAAIIDSFYSVDFLSSSEKELIEDLLQDALNENLDTSEIKTAWANLPSNQLTGNEINLIIVELTISVKDFIDNHSNEFPDGPQAIVNKIIGVIGGGVAGVLADCVEDIYCDTGYGTGPGGPWRAFKRSFIKGAIVGGIFSL